MASKRVRGIRACLADATNLASCQDSIEATPSKRSCASSASTRIKMQSLRFAPRGILLQDSPRTVGGGEEHTLQELLLHRKHVLQGGMDSIQGYIERKASFPLQKACALRIFSQCISSGRKIVESANFAASCTGFCSRSIRQWASDLFSDYFLHVSNIDDVTDESLENQLESGTGRHPKWVSIMSDEGFRREVRQYVLDHGSIRGKPNLTLQQLVTWLKDTFTVDVSISTVSLWLHDMGFSYKQFSKGVYFDGHERDDVVEDRRNYLAKLQSYSHRLWTSHSPAPNPQCRPVIRVFHDESTFYANADQSFHWTDGTKQALKQKSLGQSLMVSDFVEEVGGLLQHGGEKACLLLETQSDGYFTNDMLLVQVEKAMKIFESKYPNAQGIFIFDHAPSHMKQPDNALNVDRMNVKDGGKQPFMKDTVWNGHLQRMVRPDGVQKGMRTVLEERGVDTSGMKGDKLRETLGKYEDFQDKTSLLQQLVAAKGHVCLYLPKFHCELNPIERCWCHAKKHTRAFANGSIVRLRRIVPESLDGIGLDLIARFFSKTNDYETAYREGHTCHTVDKVVKTYKSHRRISLEPT